MKKRKITQKTRGFKFRILLLAFIALVGVSYNAYSVDHAPGNTIVDIVVNSPDHTTLETAVIAAGLADALSGDGPFTLFAPTDAAFAAIPAADLAALLADPTGALADILKYHVVSGKVMSGVLSDGMTTGTLLGKDIKVTINADGVFINNAKVTVADIQADNGVVHVIDALLSFPTGVLNQKVQKMDIEMYPNPVSEELSVNILDSRFTNGTISIYNAAGTKLYDKAVRDVNNNIDVRQFKSGIYFIQVESPEAIASRKFIVK